MVRGEIARVSCALDKPIAIEHTIELLMMVSTEFPLSGPCSPTALSLLMQSLSIINLVKRTHFRAINGYECAYYVQSRERDVYGSYLAWVRNTSYAECERPSAILVKERGYV